MIHQKLKNEEEEQEVLSRINRLNDIRGGMSKGKDGGGGGSGTGGSGGGGGGSGSSGGGSTSTSSGGGTGLKNTWKKLKGKKKKQRNLTAPEISSQDLKAAGVSNDSHHTSTATLSPLKEDGASEKKDGKKGGKHRKQSKDSSSASKGKTAGLGETVFMNVLAESPVGSLSQPDDHLHHHHRAATGGASSSEVDILSPSDRKSKSSASDVIILEPLSLSQTSGKHSAVSLSQPDTFTGNEDHFSTQSSSEVGPSNALTNEAQHGSGGGGWGGRLREETEEEEGEEGEGRGYDMDHMGSYLRGSSTLYKSYGSKQHRLNLERVHEFLESTGELEPQDLTVLQDWDGWMTASRDIV